jgi:hypothetical protein
MGPQRVLQAIGIVAAIGSVAVAKDERVAIIDLGPSDPEIRRQLATKVVAAGFAVVHGDGVEDALAGEHADTDGVLLAAAMAEAQRAFGALDCKAATAAATQAVGIAASRQAAGLAVPELPRAAAYILLCADRAGDVDAAMAAAARVRAAGGSSDVPADVWKKYPEVDTVIDRDLIALEITADVPGAEIWVDFKRAGTAPLTVHLPAGDHVIAAAAGTRRGWAAGTAIKTQTKLSVPTTERAGTWSEVGKRIAAWNGQRPTPSELAWVMTKVGARVALIRRGDTLEAYGRIGLATPPHRLGGDEVTSALADADKIIALVRDRLQAWKDRAPDPDRPLLLDDKRDRSGKLKDPPAKWWVYASILGAVAAGAVILYASDAGGDRQRIELRLPGSR